VLVALGVAQIAFAQVAKKNKETKGPRALGLVELSSDGKARLIPIAIMVDGKFYDAGAYKASPVPLALWSETVYEGEKTGVPQGLFTVGGALQTTPGNWLADGKWRPAGSEPKKKSATTKPKMGDEDEGPPKLRRGDSDKPDAAKTAPPASTQPADDKKTPAPSRTPGPPAASSTSPQPSKDSAPTEKPPGVAPPNANDDDPNRPILKRGKPETEGAAHPEVGASTGVPRRPMGDAVKGGAKPDTTKPDAKKNTLQTIPAISDAGGPEPRPYSYDIKPDEEQKYRKGMLGLAADALVARMKEVAPTAPGGKSATRTVTPRRQPRPPQPTFDDVQFRAFDLWNTNEPVFVLSATAHVPQAAGPSAEPSPTYYITLVAKKNIYDELRKLYAGVTDDHHDETPRLELIDAVDADGDGRGELLFRRISDAGKSWGVYRAGADQLFPLFEGTPGQ